jgi:hypothetical protein
MYKTKAVTPDMASAFKASWLEFEQIVLLNQERL